jgi:hypothetical protein
VFEAGFGPYHYYDTTDANFVETASGQEPAYENAHGWGVVASAALDWYFRHGWFAMLLAYALGERWVARAIWNRVATRDDSDSDIVLVGLGHRF